MEALTVAVDVGTQCGVAVFLGDKPVWNEQVNLGNQSVLGARLHTTKARKPPRIGLKAAMLRARLREILSTFEGVANKIEFAVEEVMSWDSAYAAHTYGALLGVVDEVAATCGASLHRYAVPTIKKHATGKGNADKAKMLEAARRRWPDFDRATVLFTDNMADALWIGDLHVTRNSGQSG